MRVIEAAGAGSDWPGSPETDPSDFGQGQGAVFSILDNLVPDYDTFADLFAEPAEWGSKR